MDAFTEVGIPFLESTQGSNIGMSWTPQSVDARTQTRCSSLTCYYDTVSSRPNLKLLNEHQVTEILFEDKEDKVVAAGVKATDRNSGETFEFTADKEVIMAAGAVHTPHLLQLSGIGPKSVVEAAGIKSRVDLPAVGSNFQDHPVAWINWNTTNSFPEPGILNSNQTFRAEAEQLYIEKKTGPFTKGQTTTVSFVSLEHMTEKNDLHSTIAQLAGQMPREYLPDVYDDETLLAGFKAQKDILHQQLRDGDVACLEFPFDGAGGTAAALQKPLSRGTIHLNPADPTGEPLVRFHAMQNPFDRWQVASIIRFARKLWQADAVASLNPVETVPGAQYETVDEIIDALTPLPMGLTASFAHPAGTVPMMPLEKGGAVNSDLKVYGVEKLSVIDASIMPIIPANHLQATCYMIAEKAADLIKARA
jgi:choline dehydrogenase-like flavoprotein